MKRPHLWVLLALAAGLAGCESAPVREIKETIGGLFQGTPAPTAAPSTRRTGNAELTAGIRQYEEGNYAEASRLIQAGLNVGLGRPDQVRARKYLAFIHCVSGREAACRNEFRAALQIDPSFELAASEAGHPIWGPVFRSEKARR